MSSTVGYSQLWMGSLEPYMTESVIITAFQNMGEKPLSVKVMRNKYTGEQAGYCFVHFQTDDEAKNVLHKLNGKIIPNTSPPVRFRLNKASSPSGKFPLNDNEFSLWVGDLSTDVDDYTLYKTFASRYQTIRTAKVVLDSTGFSKGFGFLRFGNEQEQKHCLTHMNGFKGLGTKAIKISNAIPKSHRYSVNLNMSGGYSSSQDYSTQCYEANYWQNYSAWQSYYDESSNYVNAGGLPIEMSTQILDSLPQEDELELIEHNTKIDVESANREIMQRDYNLWDALESSKWTPVEFYE